MLGKLFQAEWKATSRWLLPLHLILLVVTVMGKILLSTGLLENEAFVALAILSMTFYTILIIATSIITFVIIVVRFYKSLFSDEGYLTFTLPVTTNQLLISKIGVAFIWCLINTVSVILSVFILVFNEKTMDSIAELIPNLNNGLDKVLGFSGFGGVLFIIFYIFVCILSAILMFTVSICIGQLMSKHKVLGAILAYVGIYMIIQTISTVGMVAIGSITSNMSQISNAEVLKVYQITIPVSLVFSIILSGIYYFISKYIMKNKLNLD
ncbi:hypothetical protein [Anaerosacchariphilus polymeriproducens]|uniref:Uncharacterized protein n=1 Tax=Anaerosacchariphilus polymeriproducens TaxID=1812858 RepID=A0A371ARY6_9FIRM|nr:hypothetical protein [Anaerosacchariphilus polymeriproducens]RDU22318.1 hypothetical protein DWV06_13550 [Anaerosacchariphilus polymeriproducens]